MKMMKFTRRAKPDAARPSLRERLTATKAKAKQVIALNRVLMKPPASEASPVDRVALVNYASWLHMERRMVCSELYPHLGAKADRFILSANAAERFHFPVDSFPGVPTNPEKASARAVRVLDMVGVDWRSDLSQRENLDPAAMQDDDRRPAVPHGWPRVDTALLDALDDLNRLDAAQIVMGKAGRGWVRDAVTVPGYDGLEEARYDALGRLAKVRAESLTGLQMKAKALLTDSVSAADDGHYQDIAESLARDLLGATQRSIEPKPDPILAVIEESRCLQLATDAAYDLPQPTGTTAIRPEQKAASEAFHAHCNDVLLKTVPATARGCAALARYAVEYKETWGPALDEDDSNEQNFRILDLIAKSPLLS